MSRVIHFDRHEDLQREAIDQLFAAACLREVEIRRLRGYVVPRLEADLRAAIDDRDRCREEAEALIELLHQLLTGSADPLTAWDDYAEQPVH